MGSDMRFGGRVVRVVAAVAVGFLVSSAARAADPSIGTPVVTGALAAAADQTQTPTPAPGSVMGRQPLPPAPRGSRSFRRCYQEAINRRLRGAERRHFIASCRLGYGHRLFRGRGNPPAAGGTPNAPVPPAASTPPT